MTTKEILNLIKKRQVAPSGFRSKEINQKLRLLCLQNPGSVAEIIFSDIDAVTRDKLLFLYSTDHWGSCRSTDNPRWSEMMHRYIIPRSGELSQGIQRKISWFQDVHGL